MTSSRFMPQLMLAAAVSACVPGADAANGAGPTVFFASGADLQSINPLLTVHPLARQVQKHVLFLPLARYDSAMIPRPRLARWEWNADRTALTFRVRPDVRWHDGVPTRAGDVAWTLTMARDPAVAYPRARDLDAVRTIAVIDSLTVRVAFDGPQPVFPDVFTDLAILPAHRFRGVAPQDVRAASFNESPVGNGPFVFVEHRPNQRWVFERASDFPGALDRPRIARLVIAIVDESTTKLAALTSGELDFAGINPAHARFVDADPRLRVIDYPVLFSYGLVLNVRRPPFDEREVREALSLAIDRQLIVDAYLYGYGTPAAGPVPPEHPWYAPVEVMTRDTARAARLLAGRGWRAGPDGVRERDGSRLAFELLTVGSGALELEQMIQAQLRDIGVAVQIRQLELTTFLATIQDDERDFDALVTGIPGDLALGHVTAMYDGDGPLAYPGFRDRILAAAFGAVRGARTEGDLVEAWRAVQRRLAETIPTVWVYHARGVQGVNRRIDGVRLDLRGELAGVAHWSIPGHPARAPAR